MSKSTRKLIQTCKLICTILLVVVIGLQFIPYWYGQHTKNNSTLLTEKEYTALVEAQEQAEEPAAEDPTEEETTEAPADDDTADGDTAEDPSEEVTEAPTLNLGIEFYDDAAEPADDPVPTKYSIMKYIWLFKENHKNETIFMPVLVLIFAVVAIVTYVKNTYSVACSIWAILAPAVGLLGFLTVELFAPTNAFCISPTAFYLNVAVHAVTLVATLATGILRLVVFIKEVRTARAERIAKSSFAKK